jgi:hypothetical protein
VAGGLMILHNEEQMRWEEHAAHIGEVRYVYKMFFFVLVGYVVRIRQTTTAYKILIGKPHMNRQLEQIVDRRIILKCISEKPVITLRKRMNCLRTGITD